MINWCHKRVFAGEIYFIFHSYGNSDSAEQLNSCWSFFCLECEMKNRLNWITKIEPELMMELSLVLSVRQLHNGLNHLFSNSKISGFKNLEREEWIFGDNGIASMSNVSSLAEKLKLWLQEALILMVFAIESLAATEVPFSSSMTNCSTSATSCWELKLNGTWRDFEIFCFLLELLFSRILFLWVALK